MPVVLLENIVSKQRVWFGSFHNPANVGGNHYKERREATRLQAELATQLVAGGVPVIWTGDMNEKDASYCQSVRTSQLRAAAGGSVEPCQVPKGTDIDWIMGAGVTFSGYQHDWSYKDARISDHPMVSASALLPAAAQGTAPAANRLATTN